MAKKVLPALDELLDWIESSAVEVPRPSETLTDGTPNIRDFLGGSSHDAYKLAGPDLPLYAGRLGASSTRSWERKAGSFSTYSLLRLARTREVITLTEFCQGVHRLIELRHRFVPVSVDILLYAIREDAYQLGDGIKCCLRRLARGSVDSSAPVFASFVRELAVSDVGRGSVALISGYCASVLKDCIPRIRSAPGPTEHRSEMHFAWTRSCSEMPSAHSRWTRGHQLRFKGHGGQGSLLSTTDRTVPVTYRCVRYSPNRFSSCCLSDGRRCRGYGILDPCEIGPVPVRVFWTK